MKVQIAPSLLSANFGRLNEEVTLIEPYANRWHFDVMDGHFVPNISFGAPVMKWIKTALPIDVHLMIEKPWLYFEDFKKAGGDLIIVHEEVCAETGEFSLGNVLRMIKGMELKMGVSIKPKTSVDKIKDVLDLVDQVLIMTVEPGFGGQKFMEDMMPKIGELKKLGFKGDIAIDGGINDKTATICVEAGANILIAGNYIFGAGDDKEKIEAAKSLKV